MRRPPHPGRAATIRNITTRRGTCRIARHVSCMLVPMINRDAAVNRRRVLLAVGGMSLISAAVPGLARPRPDGPRPVHRAGANHRPARRVPGELARASDAIHAATGVQPALFRAPYGVWTPAVIAQCEHMRMLPVDWSVDPRDWARPGVRRIVNDILGKTRPGSIILEHDGGGNRSQTVAALRVVLPRLLREGYHFQTL